MWKYIKLRAPVLLALIFCLTSFIISLLVLLAGTKPNFLPNAWVVMYEPSSLSTKTTTTVYDWYALYYLSVCHGNTNSPGTITCTRQHPGYQMSIAHFAQHVSSSSSSSDAYTLRSRSPGTYVALWLFGIILSGIGSILLPWLLRGKRHFNGYVLLVLVFATVALLIGTIFTTVDATTSRDIAGERFPSTVLALQWAASACLMAACAADTVEWRLQAYTPKGERVNRNWMPMMGRRLGGAV